MRNDCCWLNPAFLPVKWLDIYRAETHGHLRGWFPSVSYGTLPIEKKVNGFTMVYLWKRWAIFHGKLWSFSPMINIPNQISDDFFMVKSGKKNKKRCSPWPTNSHPTSPRLLRFERAFLSPLGAEDRTTCSNVNPGLINPSCLVSNHHYWGNTPLISKPWFSLIRGWH